MSAAVTIAGTGTTEALTMAGTTLAVGVTVSVRSRTYGRDLDRD
jgi:hypothetical protein